MNESFIAEAAARTDQSNPEAEVVVEVKQGLMVDASAKTDLTCLAETVTADVEAPGLTVEVDQPVTDTASALKESLVTEVEQKHPAAQAVEGGLMVEANSKWDHRPLAKEGAEEVETLHFLAEGAAQAFGSESVSAAEEVARAEQDRLVAEESAVAAVAAVVAAVQRKLCERRPAEQSSLVAEEVTMTTVVAVGSAVHRKLKLCESRPGT